MKEGPRNLDRCRELLGQLLDGHLSEAERLELNEVLKKDPGARRFYRQQAQLHAELDRAYAGGSIALGMPPVRELAGHPASGGFRGYDWMRSIWKLAAAVAVLFGVGLVLKKGKHDAVATLVSSENAAWESVLPTAPHSRLQPGILELKQGMATVRFDSGAAVTMEAPTRLEIVSPMRARLVRGTAVIEAPQTARGFVMEAPTCHAVDLGTKFAMSASASGEESAFEVLSGEIALHPSGSKKEERLSQGEAATVTARGVERMENPFLRDSARATWPALRIGTGGKTKSITRGASKAGLNPGFLLLKSTVEPDHATERRSLVSFDLAGVNMEPYSAARLVFTMVPTKLGLAAHLPLEIRFQVYGLAKTVPFDWRAPWNWDSCPTPADGKLLGTISVPRSQQTGNVALSGPELLNFLREHRGESVVFLIVRETKARSSCSLVHAFAGDSHPEAPGPALEFFLAPEAL
jgi:ferric-dicitrate binding protein FerR (iron transport regulator)